MYTTIHKYIHTYVPLYIHTYTNAYIYKDICIFWQHLCIVHSCLATDINYRNPFKSKRHNLLQ